MLLALILILANISFAQIPPTLQGKYRGFKQQGNKVDITTTAVVHASQIYINFQGADRSFDVEKTGEPGIYKLTTTEASDWRYVKLYIEKGVLHMVWYKECDGRSVDEDFRFRKVV